MSPADKSKALNGLSNLQGLIEAAIVVFDHINNSETAHREGTLWCLHDVMQDKISELYDLVDKVPVAEPADAAVAMALGNMKSGAVYNG